MLIDDLLAAATARGQTLVLWQESPTVCVAQFGVAGLRGRGETPAAALRALRIELDRSPLTCVDMRHPRPRRRAHGLRVLRGGAA